MGWDSKVSYRPDATINVSVKATSYQKAAWGEAARRHGKASPGAFLAWAGDLYLALQRAYHDAVQEHDDSLHPVGFAKEIERQEEREKTRREREGEP
jgi:hypothetical protein